MIEECFGWMKVVGLLRKLRHRGREKVAWIFRFTAAAYNLVRMRRLLYETGRATRRGPMGRRCGANRPDTGHCNAIKRRTER
jgi:hypothetical protein